MYDYFMRCGKRGVSPIVASVFMILMVMVLASIVFLWARGFISEQIEKFGEPIENYCERASFDAVMYDGTLEVKNSGDIDIRSFSLEKTRGGTKEFENFPFAVDAGGAASSFFGEFEMDDGTQAQDVVIHAVLVGQVRGETKNSIFTCLEEGVEL